MQAAREAMLQTASREPQLVQRLLSQLGFLIGKLDNLIGTWELLLQKDPPGASPMARWIEKYSGHARQDDFLVCASPITAGGKLSELLWSRASAAVLTSATLTSCGSFRRFLGEMGLDRYRETRLLQLPSPFDYRNRAKLVVPRMQSDPRNHDGHTRDVIERMPGLTTTRGTLVLFASGRQMREAHARLDGVLKPNILVQGELPKMEIIARHKAAIDAGSKSVIFGLASFSEDVDLVGEYCTRVIIAKLHFAVPDTPLEEARREWVEGQGKSAFMEISVPEAAVRLAQSVGRLLRTVDDHQ